jgi:hypothetical protein
MNADQQIKAEPSDDDTSDELTAPNPTGPSSGRPGMVTVPTDELGKVEGGYGVGRRTGPNVTGFDIKMNQTM